MSEISDLVSVIIPFYNCERFLREAIESVLAQSYTHWELLLVDDGSTDWGTEIARQFAADQPDKIRYLEHAGHANRGVTGTRNLGAEKSRGEFLAFLDGDDVWLQRKLEVQVHHFRENPDVGLIIGPSEYWYDWDAEQHPRASNNVVPVAPGGRLYQPPYLLSASHPFGVFGAPCPSSFLMRRSAFERVGGFVEEFRPATYQLYEDTAFLTKMYLQTTVYVTSEYLDRYRCHRNSIWNRTQGTLVEEEERRFYFRWLRAYLSANPVTDTVARRAINRKAWPYRLPLPNRMTRLIRRIENRLQCNKRRNWPPCSN